MGRQVAKWLADDGTEFNTQREMVLHEMEIVDAKEIEAFLRAGNSGELPKRWREYTRLLVGWQQYRRGSDYSAPPTEPLEVAQVEVPVDSSKPSNYAFDDEAVDDDPFAKAVQI